MAAKRAKTPTTECVLCPLEDIAAKVETSIAKFADATTNLAIMMASHNTRLDVMDQGMRERNADVTAIRDTQKRDNDTLTQRIATVETTLTSKIDNVQRDLSDKLMQQTHVLTGHIDAAMTKLDDKIEDKDKTQKTDAKAISDRVTMLEKWRYLIVGGAIVIGFMLTGFFLRIAWVLIENNASQWFPWFK